MAMEQTASLPRASLFLASRLASVVQKFRHRLQEKVQQKKKKPNPFGVSYHRGIRLRALSDLERSAPPCRLTVTTEPRSAVEHQNHGKWINELFRALNDHSNVPGLSLTTVAADDKLFLSHSQDNLIETLARHATVPQAAYMFDSSTLLIAKLEALRLDKIGKWEWAEADADCKRLKEESYIANLLHLLRRLQHILFQVLVHRSITRLDEFALHWQTYWQQQKKLGEDWFTEWPSGQRPLSTTWPWNIRPSLIVLWGVCWMFYTSDQNREDKPRSPAQQLVEDSRDWMPSNFSMEEQEQARRVGLAINTSPIPRTTSAQARFRSSPTMQAATSQNVFVTSSRRLSAGAQPHTPNPYQRRPLSQGISDGRLHEPRQALGSTSFLPTTLYTQPVSFYSSPLGSRDPSGWTTSLGGDNQTSYASSEQFPSNVWPGFNLQHPPPLYPVQTPVPTFEVSPVEGQSYVLAQDSITPRDLHQPYLRPPFGDNPEMGGIEDYPSPHSERGRQGSITTPTSMPGSLAADHVTTPSSDGSKGLQISMKRGEPPRNAQNQIYCAYPECTNEGIVFRRPCEWNKHMDKHDRPYKCLEPGCDKMQGFTYSGGLLRHQREVHKKNQSIGRELYCRFPNCNRSTSRPFTRQENLKEHIRRRHVGEGAMASPGVRSVIATPATPIRSSQDRSRKRKRTSPTDFDDELESREAESDAEEDSEQVKRLKNMMVLKDSRISELEAELASIREQVSRLRAMVRI